ncbi:MAG: type III pantothenate kinase, partial [Bacteroidia bacterium]|nr:type III pantothenate kinase [Bacteroidia bacterium]
MKLSADIGNTLVKIGLFKGNELVKNLSYSSISQKIILELLKEYSEISHAIISDVTGGRTKFLRAFRKIPHLIYLDAKTKLPFMNKYGTPATLGTDRLSLVAGALKFFTGKNVLVISAGTCITYDFINSKKEYSGGSISPGMRMRLAALNHFTARLPLVNPKSMRKISGSTTADSILTGVVNGMTYEMDGFVNEYKMKYKNINVILTGGDTFFFASRLKSSIFAAPELTLVGLNEILK